MRFSGTFAATAGNSIFAQSPHLCNDKLAGHGASRFLLVEKASLKFPCAQTIEFVASSQET